MPRDYQLDGIEFMQTRKRVLNRDKPGLGKTLEAAYATVGRTLISAPNYLTEHWYEWLAGVPKGRRAHAPYAPYNRNKIAWARGSWHQRMAILEDDTADFTIINQEMMQSHGPELIVLAQEGAWDDLVLDESHHYRNREAERSKNALEVGRYMERVYELSGTPIYREVDDLYMQLRILQPDVFTSYTGFVDKFCIADESRYGTKVMGVKKTAIPELEQILSILSIGRDYKTAGRELPEVIPNYVMIDFPKPVMDAYYQMCANFLIQWQNEEIKFENYPQVMRTMRLFTAFPGKIEAAKSIVEDHHEKDKVVIFSWYRDTCEKVAKLFNTTAIHGGIASTTERRRLARDTQYVCATIEALSEGIDLSDARAVIYLEENYTPGSMEQSMARVARERQIASNADPVLVYYVHVKNTVDEIIHNTWQRRGGTASSVLKEAFGVL